MKGVGFLFLVLLLAVGCVAPAVDCQPCPTPAAEPVKPVDVVAIGDEDIYYFVAANIADPFYVPGVKGFEDAANELGVQMKFVGPSDLNLASQMKTIEELIAAPDTGGIFLYAMDVNAAEPMIKAALAKGIPFVVGAADSPLKTRTAFIGYDNTLLGEQAGEKAATILGGKGKVGTIGVIGDNVAQRRKAFEAYIKANYHDMSVVDTVTHDGSAQGGVKTLDAYLAANPDLDLIWWADGVSSQMVQPWKEKQEQGVTTLFLAMDMPEPTLKAIQDGVYVGSIGQDTYTEEYWGMKYLYAARHGERVPNSNFMGAIILDKENVGEYLK